MVGMVGAIFAFSTRARAMSGFVGDVRLLRTRGTARSWVLADNAVTDDAEGLMRLRVSEIKAELNKLGASAAAAACFEKSDLVRALVAARAATPLDNPEPISGIEDARFRVRGLSVAQLRQQLADRSVGWADLYEKSELIDRLAGLVAADLAFCPSGRVPIGKVADLGEADARAELADASTPLLLDVYAKWCGPCQMMAPLLDGLAADMRGQVRVIKLDSDAAVALARELDVSGLPTLIAYRRGKAVRRVEGALSAKSLRELCNEYLLS